MSFLSDWADNYPALLGGLWVSIRVTGLALLIGMPLGLLLALGSRARNGPLRYAVIGFVEIGRGTPALVVLQIVYFGLPSVDLTLSSFIAAALALALTTAAYTSEIIRGGLQSVPDGEVEAASALGMVQRDTLRFIVVPQGVRVAIPALMGFAILIFQASSLAYTIALPELMSQAYTTGSTTFRYLSILSLAGLMYAAITIPASWLSGRAEKSMSRHL